ncbi:tipN [Brevundimonas sp. UBA7534]|uniref:tipN n=1 Tax=Brevundimonas sp. UBA7534 TaxID=1946138 RepID=UPI0025C41DC6|nr:tipN [Brevundimonas sp. UBA7534]
MKSRNRPPLKLTNDEDAASAEVIGAPADMTESLTDEASPAAEEVSEVQAATPPPPAEPERPMSERRRRRLLEEQRQAQQRAEAERMAAEATPEPAAAELAVAAAAPLSPFERTTAPTVRTVQAHGVPAAGRRAYALAALAAVLWIGGVASWAAYEFGINGAGLDPLRLAIYALIALAPAGLALMLAHAVRQGSGLAAETRRARELAEALVAPTALAAQQTGDVLQSLRSDIDQAALAAERARNDMALLREALSQETLRLNEAAEIAGRTARRLAEQLGRERDQMQTLGAQLDSQASGVVDAVERQSRMVADASDLAQTQLREAEAALAARAADLAAAAGEAQDAARVASEDLARQTIRLENAGSGVSEQIRSVEEGLGQQRAALVTTAYALRTDQEDFSAQVESQRAQLIEHLSATRTAAGDLDQTAQSSLESLRELLEASGDQFRALIEMSQREADNFDSATKLSLDRFEALAAEARDTLMEETRRSLEALKATAEESRGFANDAAEQAQIRIDRLAETLFQAAHKTDLSVDARIEDARRIVGESAGLVDQAGDRVADRLETLVEKLNAALGQVDEAVAEIDARAAQMPDQARARVEAVRASVEEGLAALTAASRKAAEDTEALDAGFQDRVRRNYDMLTEAVRLMGVVSGETPTRRRDTVTEPEPAKSAARAGAPASVPAKEAKPTEERGFGLRGRLRLEPTEPTAPPRSDGLDWADLVGSEGEAQPLELNQPIDTADAELPDRLADAIRRMGVDPNALLPRTRVEEAARAVSAGDPGAARQIVRRVAPAAVRSVSRRVLSDAELRAEAERYVRGFGRLLAEAARGGDIDGVQGRLSSDAGRAFMLLDAAVGDLG